MDRHEELIQVPRVAQSPFSPLQPAAVLRAELLAPLPDGFVGDGDSTLRQEVLDVAEAKAESVVEPDRVADDLAWESVSVVARCFGVHWRTLPGGASTSQYQWRSCSL